MGHKLSFSIWIALCVLFLCYLVSRKKRLVKNPKRLPLPPGPPGWPIIGNLFDISNSWLWLSYSSMAQKYGRSLSAHFCVAPHDIVSKATLSTSRYYHRILSSFPQWKRYRTYLKTVAQSTPTGTIQSCLTNCKSECPLITRTYTTYALAT